MNQRTLHVAVPESLLSYTGHPFVDVGAATLAVLAGKNSPEELALADLDSAADHLLELYKGESMRSYLSTLFPNSGYVNPTMGSDKREAFYETYVRAYRRVEDIGARDAFFTGEQAHPDLFGSTCH